MRLLGLLLLAAVLAPPAQASTEACAPLEDPGLLACALAGGEASGTCEGGGYESNVFLLRLAAGEDVAVRVHAVHACDSVAESDRIAARADAEAPLVGERHASFSWFTFRSDCWVERDVDGMQTTRRCPFGERPPHPPLVLP